MVESRPSSPYLELNSTARPGTTGLDQFQLIQKREKIHRIRPRRNFFAEATYVTSPSEIWIRPLNHIADQLTIPFDQAPELEKNLQENVYVMTPLDEDKLVRARIILFDNVKGKFLLRLIDHGKPFWRNPEDIYEMKSEKDELRKYPWQAIPITLQGIEPENGQHWTDAEVYSICNAFSDFPILFVMPTFHEKYVVNNNDSEYLKASINGLDEINYESLQKLKIRHRDLFVKAGISIAEYYRILSPQTQPVLFPRKEPKMDFFEQEYFTYPNKYDDNNDIEDQAFNKTTPYYKNSESYSQASINHKVQSLQQLSDYDTTSGIDIPYFSKSNESLSSSDSSSSDFSLT